MTGARRFQFGNRRVFAPIRLFRAAKLGRGCVNLPDRAVRKQSQNLTI